MRSVTGNLKTWLQLRLTDDTSYSELREAILAFERSTTKWVDAMMPGGEMASGSGDTVPMEVDRVKGDGKFDKGEFKGKGKGKKGDWKGQKGQSKGKGYGSSAQGNHFEAKGKERVTKEKQRASLRRMRLVTIAGRKGILPVTVGLVFVKCKVRVLQLIHLLHNPRMHPMQMQRARAMEQQVAHPTTCAECKATHLRLCFSTFKKTQTQKKIVVKSFVLFRVAISVRTISLELTMVNLKHVIMLKKFPGEDKTLRSSTSSVVFDSDFVKNYEVEEHFNKGKMRLGGEVFVPGRRHECRASTTWPSSSCRWFGVRRGGDHHFG